MIRCADTSDAPTDHGLPAIGWGIIHRAYMDTTKQDSSGGRREGLVHERALLVQQAARRFGAETGRRLEARLRAVEDPGHLERVGVLIVDCETGEQLLGGIDRSGTNSS